MAGRGERDDWRGGPPPDGPPRRPTGDPPNQGSGAAAPAPREPLTRGILDTVIANHIATHESRWPRFHPEHGGQKVREAVMKVMDRVKSVEKLGFNSSGKYAYVAANDVFREVREAMIEEGLLPIAQRQVGQSEIGTVLLVKYEYDLHHVSGDYILNYASNTGSCRILFSKGTYDDKAPGKAHTLARKSIYVSIFQLPTIDPDEEDNGGADPYASSPPRRRRWDTGDDDRQESPPRDDRRSPPPDDRRDDDRAPEQSDNRRSSEPPPPSGPDDYGQPSTRRVSNPPPESPDDADFRDKVRDFMRRLSNVSNIDDADDMWMSHSGLIRLMNDNTYEACRADFTERFGQPPPRLPASRT